MSRWLITAPGADHLEMLAIENDDFVAEEISEGDVVATIQSEFFSRLSPDDLLEGFRRLISLFFRSSHVCLTKKRPVSLEGYRPCRVMLKKENTWLKSFGLC